MVSPPVVGAVHARGGAVGGRRATARERGLPVRSKALIIAFNHVHCCLGPGRRCRLMRISSHLGTRLLKGRGYHVTVWSKRRKRKRHQRVGKPRTRVAGAAPPLPARKGLAQPLTWRGVPAASVRTQRGL